MVQTERQVKGKQGEEYAADCIREKGYEIIARNYRYGRKAEVDIVAWHEKKFGGKTLCFIEVKTRKTDDGGAERSVGPAKKKHMQIAAQAFCCDNHINVDAVPIQFEQISIFVNLDSEPRFRHYEMPAN